MRPDKALKILKDQGYVKTDPNTKYVNRLGVIVYLVAEGDGGDIRIYSQSTRVLGNNTRKFQAWLRTGDVKHLPTPIARSLEFTNTGAPECYVQAYVNQSKFTDSNALVKLRKAGYVELLAKERTPGPFVSVYKVTVDGDPHFKIIVSKASPQKVASAFLSNAKDQLHASHKTIAVKYRYFCKRNASKLTLENVDVESLAYNLLPGAGKVFAKLYLDSATPELILNAKW